jgi:hypothetical protein
LPPAVADALERLGLAAHAVGRGEAPAEDSPDDENCRWCKERGAVLVTNDRGKKDHAILDALAIHRVHAVFVHNDLRGAPPHHLARAILCAETRMDEIVAGKHLIRHRLKPSGRLEKR